MNQSKNLEIVNSFGDRFQLQYGTEFGFYAKNITREDIFYFCEKLNMHPWMQFNGYYLSAKHSYKSDNYCVTAKRYGTLLHVPVKLLDHSVFFLASEEDWLAMDEKLFKLVMKEWQKFLSTKIDEYDVHLDKTCILSQNDREFAI